MAQGALANTTQLIVELYILPIQAKGDSSVIRQSAAQYSALPQTVARNVPPLILWTLRCCSEQRAVLARSAYGGNEGTRSMMMEQLKTVARDLMMYAGFLKYRLPASVNDTLARIAADSG